MFQHFIKYPDIIVLAFISKLGAKQQAKNAQVLLAQVLLALTPSV
jgi:hypothetical protein